MFIILIKYHETNLTIIGDHKYNKKWDAVISKVLEAKMVPKNNIDKYALAVCKKEDIVGHHFPKGKAGKYAKMIYFFLKSEMLRACKVKLTGKRTNFRDDKGLGVIQ